MSQGRYRYGMIGLGTMGSNLVLNISDKGFSVAGYDKDSLKVEGLNKVAEGKNLRAIDDITEFIAALETPRIIMLLVPAGPIVDAVIFELRSLVSPGDIIIDCGNSHFTDTQVRTDNLIKDNIHFMGIGVSGGETGARFGPSIMPGGDLEAYKLVAPMLESISAKVNGQPCTAYMGKGAAGHYVKMVHNGIEYALMQLIAESYHILKVLGGLDNPALHQVYSRWNKGKLQSFLIEITTAVFAEKEESGSGWLVDYIADTAQQKGTGAWMSQDAMKILAPIPAIDSAVSQRMLSALKKQRVYASESLASDFQPRLADKAELMVDTLEDALYSSFLLVYAQGLSMLQQGSVTYGFGINISSVAAIWRNGCIIRAAMLEDILKAFSENESLANLMLSPSYAEQLSLSQKNIRDILCNGISQRIPLPAFSACLGYYDSYHSKWLPANLIQAQRDFFGAHTYERIDKEGFFHTQWTETIQ